MGRHKRGEHSRLAGRGKQSGIARDGSYGSSSVATHVEQFQVQEIPAAPLRCATRCLAQPPQRSTIELFPDIRVQYLRDDVRDDGEGCSGEYDDMLLTNKWLPSSCVQACAIYTCAIN
jgi:hypothetical protein